MVVPLEIRRLQLASLRGVDGRRWPVHGFVVTHDGGAAPLIGGVANTPRVYADRASDHLPSGQASDLPTWRDWLRLIQSLDPDRAQFCHHTDVLHR